tara:strand:+ start:3106 stop:3264 length:159 start_codon:yes stop_codon:yes gene_type:complete
MIEKLQKHFRMHHIGSRMLASSISINISKIAMVSQKETLQEDSTNQLLVRHH